MILVLLSALLVGCVSENKETTPTPVSLTLKTDKINKAGQSLGTEEITLNGTLYDDRFEVTLNDFGGATQISASKSGEICGTLMSYDFADFKYVILGAYLPVPNRMSSLDLVFSEDLDYWLIADSLNDCYYYASVSGKATTQELIDYFAPKGVKNSRPAE